MNLRALLCVLCEKPFCAFCEKPKLQPHTPNP